VKDLQDLKVITFTNSQVKYIYSI